MNIPVEGVRDEARTSRGRGAVQRVNVGIIGGIGHRLRLEGAEEHAIPTPYGSTSAPVVVGSLGGRTVAFISRRGEGEVLQPHLVPYRANVWALASLGVRAIVSMTAAGGLRESFSPGTFVVSDQVVDRTMARASTFFDQGEAVQLAAADPFDATLRALVIESLNAQHVRVRDFGTVVVINGPRFDTRAESRWHAALGGDLVNMTLMPEVPLALELGIGVVNLSFITDSDSLVPAEHADAASIDNVRRRVQRASPVLERTLTEFVQRLPASFDARSAVPASAVQEVLARVPS